MRLEADHVNLRRAAEHAASDPDGTAQVLRFGVALRRYWIARSHYHEALGLLLPVLERSEARANPRLFGAALVVVTAVSPFVDLAPGRRSGEQAVELGRELHDERLLTDALSMLSAACFFFGEMDLGLTLGQEAVERARQLGDDVLLGQSLMGSLFSSPLVQPDQSGQLLAEAIACTERSGDQLMRSFVHNNAAVYALAAGDLPAARAHLEQAAQATRAIGRERNFETVNLGWVRREEGDLDGARSTFEESLRISRRSGEQPGMGYASLGLACLATDLGDWDRAATLHGVAQAFLDKSGEPWQVLEARYRQDSLAEVRAHQRDEQFDRAYGKGMALSLGKAIDLALRRAGPA